MTCPWCGMPVLERAGFCGDCGKPLRIDDASISALTVAPPPESAPEIVRAPPLVATAEAPQGVIAPPPGPVRAAPEQVDESTTLAPVRGAAREWRLVLPDGDHVTVGGILILGRDPARLPEWPAGELVTVDDPAKSVSKTHAVFERVGDHLFVNDLGSTNGVVVTQADGTTIDLESRQRIELDPGSDVELGAFLIQIEKS